ncbi:hypothetical protein MUY27_02615 [Mucilaginibacter sp. RS28]|uniref:Uncharacterized protein n=1 Tax=Mucilaginibacter straminoryzae TaxID=2932774 RepID=A0A9X1WZV6_9SPHI|nr:hypothetical protein [Mucilaginibacter straminoryzae]MCJ8208584.1 hypothetical protein [Mucilaginibacter straminoryzae]
MATNTNTINVTACDNELIILAYQWGGSFELMRILSGNTNPVNVNINIANGQYSGPIVLNGVNSALSGTYDVYLSPGSYSLLLMGVNWGGPQQFTIAFNGQTYSLPYSQNGDGLVYNSAPIAFTVA